MSVVSSTPVVSVVVATHDRAHMLPRLVSAIETQEGVGPVELVIVDDASTDSTWGVLHRLAASAPIPLTPVRLERNSGPASARNAGWRAARGRLIVFTDDDCIPQPGWLRALVDSLTQVDLVQGRTIPIPDREASRGPFAHTLWVREEGGRYETCNIAYKRELLEGLGGFDEGFRYTSRSGGRRGPIYGEDTDLAWRAKEAGARASFEPAALVHHEVYSSSYGDHLRSMRRRAGLVRTVKRHPGLRRYLHSRWFYQPSHPPALLAGLGIALVLTRPRSVTRWAGLLLVLPYARYRRVVDPMPCRPRNWVPVTAMALAADLVEVTVLAESSVRYRTLLL
jgi:glycosyltransferase involved in cell wall biosynthesis